MKQRQRVASGERVAAVSGRAKTSGRKAGSTRRRRGPVDLIASAEQPKERTFSPIVARIADYYRPLKKPVTIRIDADVLAWFKKDGRRYQSRINAALRKAMERELKNS